MARAMRGLDPLRLASLASSPNGGAGPGTPARFVGASAGPLPEGAPGEAG